MHSKVKARPGLHEEKVTDHIISARRFQVINLRNHKLQHSELSLYLPIALTNRQELCWQWTLPNSLQFDNKTNISARSICVRIWSSVLEENVRPHNVG